MYMLSAWSPWLKSRWYGFSFYSLNDWAKSIRSCLSSFRGKYYLMKRRFANNSITPSMFASTRFCGSFANSLIMSPYQKCN